MGDVAMTVPVLATFSKAHPTIRITVLTKKQFAPLFRDLQTVTVLLADFTATHKGVYGLYKLSKQIRNTSVDAVADLHNVLRTKILSVFLLGLNFALLQEIINNIKISTIGFIFKCIIVLNFKGIK